MLYEHQGWVSTSFTLMQVSNVVSPNVNGKSQLLHPVGISNCDQMARNPVRVIAPSELNVISTLFVFVIMVNGVGLSPQYFSSSICNQSISHELSDQTSKCRNVIFILCPSSTPSVQVYTNIQIQTIDMKCVISNNSFYLISIIRIV